MSAFPESGRSDHPILMSLRVGRFGDLREKLTDYRFWHLEHAEAGFHPKRALMTASLIEEIRLVLETKIQEIKKELPGGNELEIVNVPA